MFVSDVSIRLIAHQIVDAIWVSCSNSAVQRGLASFILDVYNGLWIDRLNFSNSPTFR